MDEKSLGYDIVIGLIGNIIYSGLVCVVVAVYKSIKKQTAPVGWLLGISLTTLGFLISFSLLHFFLAPFKDTTTDYLMRAWISMYSASTFVFLFYGAIKDFFTKDDVNHWSIQIMPPKVFVVGLLIVPNIFLLVVIIRPILKAIGM